MFLKVIFLHLTSAIRARWGIVVQFSDNFLMCTPIDGIHNLGSVSSSNFVIKCNCSMRSIEDLPTTNII